MLIDFTENSIGYFINTLLDARKKILPFNVYVRLKYKEIIKNMFN